MKRELLVLTDHVGNKKQQGKPTYRLIIPPFIACDLPSPIDYDLRIWWAERYMGRTYLKACLDDCVVQTRYTRQGERQFVALGKLDTSSYIYRDKPTCSLEGIIDTNGNVGHWQTIELDQNQVSLLIKLDSEVSPIMLSLDDAVRMNRRVLYNCWPRSREGVIHPKQLWRIFKRNATVSELVRVNGLDPYETSVAAALVDMGVVLSMKEILRHLHRSTSRPQPNHYERDSTRIEAPAFTPLGPLARNTVLRQLQQGTPAIKINGISNEHEMIVAALAFKLYSMKSLPYLSPLVDLAVINERSALFFEVKTVNQKNLLDQVRAAIGQLLEYRFIYKDVFDNINLVFVAPATGPLTDISFAQDFLSNCGIDWVVWLHHDSKFKSLERVLDSFYHSIGYTSNRGVSISSG